MTVFRFVRIETSDEGGHPAYVRPEEVYAILPDVDPGDGWSRVILKNGMVVTSPLGPDAIRALFEDAS